MQGTWEFREIGAHVADVYRPAGGSSDPPFGLIFLHGVGGESLRGQTAFTAHMDAWGMPCVCPWGAQTWWTDRVLPSYHPTQSALRYVLDDVLAWCRKEWGLGPGRLGLFGISMGGHGALRMSFKYPDLFPVVAGIASALEPQAVMDDSEALQTMYNSPEQCRQDSAALHVVPHQPPSHIYFCCDPGDVLWHRGNDRLHEKLNALGIAHECDLSTQAGGHTWEYFRAMAEPTLRFLYRGLVERSRRLL